MVPDEVVEATAREARAILGWYEDDEALHLAAATVWGLAEGYMRRAIVLPRLSNPTRFDAPEDLASVALAATCRLAIDPSQSRTLRTTDSRNNSQSRSGGFQGFTLAEVLVLNRYRRRVV